MFNFNIQSIQYSIETPSLTAIIYSADSMGERLGIHFAVSNTEETLFISDRFAVERDIQSYAEAGGFSTMSVTVTEFTNVADVKELLRESTAERVIIELSANYPFSDSDERELSQLAFELDKYIFISTPHGTDTLESLADVCIQVSKERRGDDLITVLEVPKNRYGSPLTSANTVMFTPVIVGDNSYGVS